MVVDGGSFFHHQLRDSLLD